MSRSFVYSLAAVLGLTVVNTSYAQTPCTSAYRIVNKVVYDQEPVKTYRLEYETQLVERTVTVQKPVWETEMRVKRYTVAKPVTETSERIERTTVMKPVWETAERDVVKLVTETEMRSEQYTVRKPVYETAEREVQYTVRKAVDETVMQDQQQTVYEQVTTLRTQYVDQGGFVEQQYVAPGATSNRLQWVPGGYSVSTVTGQPYYQRAGYHWVPTQAPAVVTTQRQYVPNVVAQQVPQTQMVAKVVTQQVPIQVTRYVDEIETKRVPYQTVRYEDQIVERQVPVQVQKEVVEKQAYRVCKMVEEVQERTIPVTTQRIEYEQREEQIPVKVCKMVTENRVLQEPHTVAKWVAYEQTRMTPRVVAMKVPVDPCGEVIESHYWPSEGTVVKKEIITPPTQTQKKVTPKAEALKPVEDRGPADATKVEEEVIPMGESRIKPKSELVQPGAGFSDKKLETEAKRLEAADTQPSLDAAEINKPTEAKKVPTPAGQK